MKLLKKTFLFSFLLLSFFSCSKDSITQNSSQSNADLYYKAISDAMIAEESEISNNLIAINENNSYLKWKGNNSDKRVLMSTMIAEKYKGSYRVGDTMRIRWSETWVTAVPEIKDWIKSHRFSQSYTLRCQQLLGLPEREGKYYFVEMWTLPNDMFRPSPDWEINDNVCSLNFPAHADSSYKAWFYTNILSSYYPEQGQTKYPWTRLGYTYDWGNQDNEVGLSEFVVRQNSQVIIESITELNEYFSGN